MTTDTHNKQSLTDYVDGLGLAYVATFVPKAQPKEQHPQLHWSIQFSVGRHSLTVPYSQGMGHVKGYKQFHKTPYDKRNAEALYRETCETGKLYRHMQNIDFNATIGTQPAPDILDVLYCLVSDADVLNYACYEDWASELGFDPDSRTGEATYRQCLQQSLGLRNLIGNAALEKLAELFRDY